MVNGAWAVWVVVAPGVGLARSIVTVTPATGVPGESGVFSAPKTAVGLAWLSSVATGVFVGWLIIGFGLPDPGVGEV